MNALDLKVSLKDNLEQDPRLQGQAPGFRGGLEVTCKGQDRYKTVTKQGNKIMKR